MVRKRLGELLLEHKLITTQQLEQALAYRKENGQRLGASLVALRFITESQLCEVLAQELCLKAIATIPDQVDRAAMNLLRSRFCEINDLFPVSISLANGRKTIVVAMADPSNIPAIEEIQFSTGLIVTPVIAPLSEIRLAIRRHYHKTDDVANPDNYVDINVSTDIENMVIIRPGGSEQTISAGVSASTSDTAAASMGSPAQPPDYELKRLEQMFWAILRILAKKGLITREEFMRELSDKNR